MKAYIRKWSRLPTLAFTLLMGLIATSACDTSTPGSAAATATPTATPSPTADPRVELASMVAAAGMLPQELNVTAPVAQETIARLAMPCDSPLVAQYVAAHSWTFSDAKPAVVSHSVYAYYPETGRAVVDQLGPALTTCKTWTWAGTWQMAVVGQFTVALPAGADNAVAYCHHGTILTGATKGDKVYLCAGATSRGHLVTLVSTVKLTLAEAQNDLKAALPLATAALVRAVASP